jgi:hypothetical protein
MAWDTIEAAIQNWVVAGSGYASGKVIWANQNGVQPGLNFITMSLGDILPVGGPDPGYYLTNLSRPAGQEVEEHVSGLRSFGVTLEVTTSATTGTAASRAILSRVQTSLGLESVRSSLALAGATPFDLGTVRSLPVLLGPAWAGRAVLEVRFYTREEMSAYHPYIDDVDIESFMGPPDSGTRDDIDI